MCTRTECISLLRQSAPYFRKEYGVKSMSLFGSMARGDSRADSDVDIFVDMQPSAFKVVELKDYLRHLLGMPVDVVRRHTGLNAYLLQEIARDEVIIFAD